MNNSVEMETHVLVTLKFIICNKRLKYVFSMKILVNGKKIKRVSNMSTFNLYLSIYNTKKTLVFY